MTSSKDTQRHEESAERRSLLETLTVVAVPLLAASLLAWMVIEDNLSKLHLVEMQATLVDVSDAGSLIVSEMQRERGRSSGFLSSGGTAFEDELAAQRIETDAALSDFRQTLDRLRAEKSEFDRRNGLRPLIVGMDRAAALLNQLPEIRASVDAQNMSRTEMMVIYSKIVRALLTVTDLITISSAPSPGERLGALDGLLQAAMEFAGQERAAGAVAFASDTPAAVVLDEMARLQARQRVLTDRMTRLAPEQIKDDLRAILRGAAAQERNRMRAAVADPALRASVDPNVWFRTTTDLIDQGMALSRDLRDQQQIAIAAVDSAFRQRHLIAVIAIVAALSASVLAAIWQARKVVRPMRDLAINLRRLAAGETDIAVECTDRQDLVGLLGRNVADLVQTNTKRFEDFLFQAPIATSIDYLDTDRRRHNPAMARFLNMDLADLDQRNLAEFLPPEDRERAIEERALFEQGGTSTWRHDLMFHRPDGTVVWGDLTRSFIHGTGDAPDFAITQVRDITEAKRIEVAKTNFVSTVSHELRTPLTSVSSAVGLLANQVRTQNDPMQQRLVDLASSNCKRLLSLINDLLDVDRLMQGGVALNRQRHELGKIVAREVMDMSGYARELDVTLVVEPPDRDFYAYTDANRVGQVLSNLVSNAAKFSPPGSNVVIRTEGVDQDRVRISVIDNGPGIADEFEDEIFECFKQGDGSATRAKGGSGIGLNISHGLVTQMGGEIGFHNNPNGGATFWFVLPGMGTETSGGIHGISERNKQSAIDDTLPTILHVEDDGEFSELLGNVLAGRARLLNARSFKDAEDALRQQPYELVLLDYDLPDGSGTDLLENPVISATSIPVVGLSASGDKPAPLRIELNILKSKLSMDEIGEILLRVIARREETRAELDIRKSA